MSGLIVMGAVLLALLIGIVFGAAMQEYAAKRAYRRRREAAMQIDAIKKAPGRRRIGSETGAGNSTTPGDKPAQKPLKKRLTASKLIALGVLFVDGTATYIVLGLCGLAILRQFEGALPYLTTLIGALQAATGYVLGHYFKKSCKENTKGGITYDAALGKTKPNIFDTA